MKLYEGMFLLDTGPANKDWDAAEGHVHGILERHGASIKKSQKWGERKLAYEIAGHKRGVYMLVHFEAEGDAIAPVRRDAGLSDLILRALFVVDTDGLEAPDIMGDPPPPRGDRPRRGDRDRADGPRGRDSDRPKADGPKPEEPKAEAARKPEPEPQAEEAPAPEADDKPEQQDE